MIKIFAYGWAFHSRKGRTDRVIDPRLLAQILF
jgi:hypothetical protein